MFFEYAIENILVEIVSVWLQVVLGTLLAALVPVVGFNAVMTSEHFASFMVSLFLYLFPVL